MVFIPTRLIKKLYSKACSSIPSFPCNMIDFPVTGSLMCRESSSCSLAVRLMTFFAGSKPSFSMNTRALAGLPPKSLMKGTIENAKLLSKVGSAIPPRGASPSW